MREQELGDEMGGLMILDFASPETSGNWIAINDTVMGGISSSTLVASGQGTVFFRGTLSLEHNGGFASVRTSIGNAQLGDCAGFRMRVRGDGRHYKLRVRTAATFDGPAYESEFMTVSGTWMTVTIPFLDMVATFRGRVLSNTPKLDGAEIQQIGLMISDRKDGPFELEVDWIEAYRTGA